MLGHFTKIVALTAVLLGVTTDAALSPSSVADRYDSEHPDAERLFKVLAAGKATTVNKCRNNKHLHLTYDDGPGSLTNNLLDDLAAAGVKASFYINGNNFKSNGPFTKRAFEEGHVIASHTWSHIDLRKADRATINEQMQRNHNAVFQMTGKNMAMMRPPYGATNDLVKEVLADLDYTIVLWNVDTNDWRQENKRQDAAADYVGAQARKGSKPIIALMHDIHKWSALSAPNMIRQVRAAGYQLVDLETCLGMKPYHRDDWTPKHDVQLKVIKTCTAGKKNPVSGVCLSQKDCDHFEAGDKWGGKCPGSADIKCCTGGCYSMCQDAFGRDDGAAAQCKQSCIAARNGQLNCESADSGAEDCFCDMSLQGSRGETACRSGYAYGMAHWKWQWECQRLCASTMYWLRDNESCVAGCQWASQSGRMGDCEGDDSCTVGQMLGRGVHDRVEGGPR